MKTEIYPMLILADLIDLDKPLPIEIRATAVTSSLFSDEKVHDDVV